MRLNFWPYMIINIISCLPLGFTFMGTNDSRYVGCIVSPARNHNIKSLGTDSMTNSVCIEHCKKHGGTYAMTSAFRYCDCSSVDRFEDQQKGDDSACDTTCKGDPKEKCGRFNLVSIPGVTMYDQMSVYRVCELHKYGRNCTEDCHCGEEGIYMCNPRNGKCGGNKKTCQIGWTNWPECQSSCIQGPNDLNCTGECHCLTGVPCDHNGECDQSKGRRCAVGYASKGFPKCDIKCDPGTYGDDCKKNCPSCRHRGCDPTDGTCQSCPAGYKGIKCQEFCEDGYYGFDCMKRCKGHCANVTCSPEDGSCPGGCLDGYEGTRCDKPSKATTMKGEIAVVIIGIASLAILLIEDLGC